MGEAGAEAGGGGVLNESTASLHYITYISIYRRVCVCVCVWIIETPAKVLIGPGWRLSVNNR